MQGEGRKAVLRSQSGTFSLKSSTGSGSFPCLSSFPPFFLPHIKLTRVERKGRDASAEQLAVSAAQVVVTAGGAEHLLLAINIHVNGDVVNQKIEHIFQQQVVLGRVAELKVGDDRVKTNLNVEEVGSGALDLQKTGRLG
jgi:hypothetical protein